MDKTLKLVRKIVKNYAKATGMTQAEALKVCMPMLLKILEQRINESFKDNKKKE